ncbi:MAG TPA: inositol oxygenase family protein [Gemmataceae bacterium]|nr:inositol oxygenase family protein [Gemmataceae bacterium]
MTKDSQLGVNVGGPMQDLDDWEEVLRERYPAPGAESEKKKEEFRNYESSSRPSVREFYRLNHRHQTLAFVLAKKREYLPLRKKRMGMWEAMDFLNTLVDDSDPDTSLSQIEHLVQVAEAIRRDGRPRWFILTGLLHDLGKILCLLGEPQWAVVGDTFPVGCAFSDKIVYPEFFADNPDSQAPAYQTPCGIYQEGCGLANVHLSWGHDEYLYQVVKDYLPEEALYMIRYHSFYPGHRENAYPQLMNEHDRNMFDWVRAFNPYDLYTKSAARPDVAQLRPFYEELIAEFFPPVIQW